jgi:hypothetical protein
MIKIMSKAEVFVNVAALAAITYGAAVGVSDFAKNAEDRNYYNELVNDKVTTIQHYREEHPGTTTLPISIEDGYTPKIEAARAASAESGRDAITSFTIGLGGLAVVGGSGVTAMARSRRKLESDFERYKQQRDERVSALTNVLSLQTEHLMAEEGVPLTVIRETADRVLEELDDRRAGKPLHANSRNEWAPEASPAPVGDTTPADRPNTQFDIVDSTVQRAPSPADSGKTIPTFLLIESSDTAPDSNPAFVVGDERWQPVIERPIERPTVRYPVGPVAVEPTPVVEAASAQPVQWPVAPAYPQPTAPSGKPPTRRLPRNPRRKPEKGI